MERSCVLAPAFGFCLIRVNQAWLELGGCVKLDPVASELTQQFRVSIIVACLIAALCVATFHFYLPRLLIADIAWLMEGSRRWMAGGDLYVDVIEVNPPLIFYENLLLTAGQLTHSAFLAGVCTVIALGGWWVLRLAGSHAALASVAAMILSGASDFGQREHLALIFAIPFLLGDKAGRGERIALGLWAFLGVGLKPTLAAVACLPALVRAWEARSWRPLFSAELVTLGIACLAYVTLIAILHPAYFIEIVPLAWFVYDAYGRPPSYVELALCFCILSLAVYCFAANDNRPLAAAALGALLSYFLQGKHWSYHIVPPLGLAILLGLLSHRRLCHLLAVLLMMAKPLNALPDRTKVTMVPHGRSFAVLIAHLSGAYPGSLYCGMHHATRYPSLWTLPGAWNKYHDADPAVRARARQVLVKERAIIRADILSQQPESILIDIRTEKPYFQHPFDYTAFFGPLPGYRYHETRGPYAIWTRNGPPADGCRMQAR